MRRQVRLGLNKSMIVELPREMREVMVSNPKKLDAVLQTSTRAYLIGTDLGEASIFFADKDGHQIVTLEVTVERDLSGLSDLLNRLLPNSKIQVQGIGERVVLTGTVTTPLDSTRASEIVASFLGELDKETGSSNSGAGTAINITSSTSAGAGGGGGGGGSSTNEPSNVINMITVENREQVLLKVSVVEMERNIIKQFGVDLGTLINSGNFAFAALSKLPFPINTQGGGVIAPFIPNPLGAAPGDSGNPLRHLSGCRRRRRAMAAGGQPRANGAPGA